MGEYIDVGIQTSILPLSIILSSIVLGIFALFGEETENDDDEISWNDDTQKWIVTSRVTE